MTRLLPALLALCCIGKAAAAEPPSYPFSGETKLVHFDPALPQITNAAPGVDYKFDLPAESFEISVPRNYTGRQPFGLFVFMNAGDQMTLPEGWADLLEKEKLICVLPQKIGNNQPFGRRVGLTFVGLLKTMERYKIDPKRVYTGGMSGGARCSLQLAWLHNDVIAGNIGICGANFYQPVPRVKAISGADYGVWPVPPDRVAAAKSRTRFAFITGKRDFRYGNILDIYHNGFVKHGFQATLIDQPNMGHELCRPKSLLEAFQFVDGGK